MDRSAPTLAFCKHGRSWLSRRPCRTAADPNIGSDLKGMTKITSGLLILRNAKSPDWPGDVDTQMNNWTTQYINWLQTSTLAYQEATATK